MKPRETDFEPSTIGEHIRKRRLELGLSQKEAAKRLGYCWTTVLNWENGKREPGVECIPAIIAFLGYDPFPEPRTLSEQLAALRRKLGWTIKEAARQLSIDPDTWGRWEKTDVPWERYRAIVAAFIHAEAGRCQPDIDQGQQGSGGTSARSDTPANGSR